VALNHTISKLLQPVVDQNNSIPGVRMHAGSSNHQLFWGHLGKFGEVYDQGLGNKVWAQTQILTQCGPHLGHIPHSINIIINAPCKVRKYSNRYKNPNTLPDLSVGVLTSAHHRRRSSGPRINHIALCWSRRPLCSSYILVRLDDNTVII
jgi:hypothetical protein